MTAGTPNDSAKNSRSSRLRKLDVLTTSSLSSMFYVLGLGLGLACYNGRVS